MPGNPFRTVWFYNDVSGAVIEELAIGDTIQAHLPGWHGPFASKQAALNFYSQNAASHPNWKAPAGFGANVTNTVGAGASNAAKAVASAAGKAFSFQLGASNISGWFARGLKVVFGGILVIAGILKLSNADKTLNQVLPLVGGPAGKVLKV